MPDTAPTDTAPIEKIDNIANKCLELLETRLSPEYKATQHSAPAEVKEIGEALKALAEGIEGCKKAMSHPGPYIYTGAKR